MRSKDSAILNHQSNYLRFEFKNYEISSLHFRYHFTLGNFHDKSDLPTVLMIHEKENNRFNCNFAPGTVHLKQEQICFNLIFFEPLRGEFSKLDFLYFQPFALKSLVKIYLIRYFMAKLIKR